MVVVVIETVVVVTGAVDVVACFLLTFFNTLLSLPDDGLNFLNLLVVDRALVVVVSVVVDAVVVVVVVVVVVGIVVVVVVGGGGGFVVVVIIVVVVLAVVEDFGVGSLGRGTLFLDFELGKRAGTLGFGRGFLTGLTLFSNL